MTPIGTLIRNSQCQLTVVTRYPPITGPNAGPAIAATPQIPSAVPRRWGGNSS